MSGKSHAQQHGLPKEPGLTKALLTLPLDDVQGERKVHHRHGSAHSLTHHHGSLSADSTPLMRQKPRASSSTCTLAHAHGGEGAVERESSASRTFQASRRPPPMRSSMPGEHTLQQRGGCEASVPRVQSMPKNFASTCPALAGRGGAEVTINVHQPASTPPQAHQTPPRPQRQSPPTRHSHSAPHASGRGPPQAHATPQHHRRRLGSANSAAGSGCEAAAVAAAAAAASRDPVAALREDDPSSPDCPRLEERRSKSSFELQRKSSRLKPMKKFGWCDESQGPPQASSRALSVVSTAASSQDEATSPINSNRQPPRLPGRSLWLGDFADLPCSERDYTGARPEAAPVASSPKAKGCPAASPVVSGRGPAAQAELEARGGAATPKARGQGPAASPALSGRTPAPHAEEEASARSAMKRLPDAKGEARGHAPAASPMPSGRGPAMHAEEEASAKPVGKRLPDTKMEVTPSKAESVRKPPKQSAWVVPGVPVMRSPVAASPQEKHHASSKELNTRIGRLDAELPAQAGPEAGGAQGRRPRTPSKSSNPGSPEKRPVSAAGALVRRLSAALEAAPLAQSHHALAKKTTPCRKVIQRLEEGDKIFDLYSWDKVLQEEGNGGKVVICRSKRSGGQAGPELVLKIRAKAELQKIGLDKQYRRVMERMLTLPPHPGVVQIFEVWEDDSFFYVVMEKANGGSLFGSLVNEFRDGCMPASAVKQVMRDILEAVGHVHKQGMLHRDIKPDNLVMHAQGGGSSGSRGRKRAMLIDFDHADPDWIPGTRAEESDEVFGTLRFNAPEAMLGSFQPQGDLYSVGVILYLLMTGHFPVADEVFSETPKGAGGMTWSRRRRTALLHRMREAHIDFECSPWPDQPACKDLCRKLLAWEARNRPESAGEALRHEWFRQEEPNSGAPLQ